MPTPDPQTFADAWVRAWNDHDVEAVLAHFHDDVLFSSPVAARVSPRPGEWCGQGRAARLLVTALGTLPGLHFEVIGVYRGESLLVINYRNQRGESVNEVLNFDGDSSARARNVSVRRLA